MRLATVLSASSCGNALSHLRLSLEEKGGNICLCGKQAKPASHTRKTFPSLQRVVLPFCLNESDFIKDRLVVKRKLM